MVSVIIPIYNSEFFLKDSIDSVLKQTYSDYEIILIDDGSTDQSSSICSFYCDRYPNIKYIYKENGGVTSARRLGVSSSKGDYILFLDSDDCLDSLCLEKMLSYMSNSIDVVVSEVKYSAIITPKDYVNKVITGLVPAGINGKLYRKELFDNNTLLLSREINIGEDLIMNVKLGLNCTRNIYLINSTLYDYRYNPNSVIHTRVYCWEYEARFIDELNAALGEHKNEYRDALMLSYFITIEKLIINKIDIDWYNKYIQELLMWAQNQRLPLRNKVILGVRNAKVAKYILAILRRFK